MDTAGRLSQLRSKMDQQGISACVLTPTDEFGAEIPAESNRWIKHFSGFSESMGCLVVTDSEVALFCAPMFVEQAKKEVGEGVEVFSYNDERIADWLAERGIQKLGYNSKTTSRFFKSYILQGLEEVCLDDGFFDDLWPDRPPPVISQAYVYPLEYAGQTWQQKLEAMRKRIDRDETILVTSPHTVNWLFNIRGSDYPFDPVCKCYAVVTKTGKPKLYIDENSLTSQVRMHFGDEVETLPLAEIYNFNLNETVLFDRHTCPQALYIHFSDCAERDYITLNMRMRKNSTELECIRRAVERNSNYIYAFMQWIERHKGTLDEVTAINSLHEYLKSDPSFLSLAYPIICGVDENGAGLHYSATPATNKNLKGGELLVLDVHCHYKFGSTDVTRTIALKPELVPLDLRLEYTFVLKGLIDFCLAEFQAGTQVSSLDNLARSPIKVLGLDYAHLTCHTVGSCTNLHESPQDFALHKGMVLGVEPACYPNNKYGIRLENMVEVVSNGKGQLKFETLTKIPFDRNLILEHMLSPQQKQWLKDYNEQLPKHIQGAGLLPSSNR